MSGASRRTNKIDEIRRLARLVGIDVPRSRGGTIPKEWLCSAVVTLWSDAPASEGATKSSLLRTAIEHAGGTWKDDYVTEVGSTITGEALTALCDLIELNRIGDMAEDDDTDLRGEALERIAEILSELSAMEEFPQGSDQFGNAFEASDVDFKSMDWVARLLLVSPWLNLQEEVSLGGMESDGAATIENLFSGVGLRADECVNWEEGVPILTEFGSIELVDHLETSVAYVQVFIGAREFLSIGGATETWLRAWEETPDGEADMAPINAETKSWSISQFIDLATEGDLELSPTYQRSDVWPQKDSQELIVSVLRRIPLPSVILLARDGEHKFEVVDGKQRLTALLRFTGKHPAALERVKKADADHPGRGILDDFKSDYPEFRKKWKSDCGETLTVTKEKEYFFPFKLPTKLFNEELKGKYYSDIRQLPLGGGNSAKVRQVFETQTGKYEIPVILYQNTPIRQIHEVFHLYNKQGKQLNAEEIRNALYHRLPLTKLLLGAAGDNPNLAMLVPYADDEELEILRKLARLLEEYRFGNNRYNRTKVLSWLFATIYHQPAGRLTATSKHVTSMLDEAQKAQKAGDVHRLNEPAYLRQQLRFVYAAISSHAAFDGWAPAFKDRKDGSKWMEVPLVASLTGVMMASCAVDDVEEALEDKYDELLQFTATNLSPENRQSKTQWDFIARIAFGMLEVLELDQADIRAAMQERLKTECVGTLNAAIL